MIRFNEAAVVGSEIDYIASALESKKLSGDSIYGNLCQQWIEERFLIKKCLVTPSCTAALEMAGMLIGLKPGDEVIMPSYTFVSTANAFVMHGARIVFVDIRKDTMNIDEKKIEDAITDKTKAIVPVHYAGVSCEMDEIMGIAKRHKIYVIEDAAQAMMSTYKGKALGSIGDLATFSFHETKNYTSGGEGGALLINNKDFIKRAEIIREKGTNRSQFFRGQVDKYTWVDVGSSYLPSEIQSAYLYSQLEHAEEINDFRLDLFEFYYTKFKKLEDRGVFELPTIPDGCRANGHMFYLKVDSLEVRSNLISFLKEKGVMAVFHYIPLHSSPAGQTFGRFFGDDRFTTVESEKLVRLPMWYGLKKAQAQYIVDAVFDFFA
ncbi:dTDP-4-amino-4,6-dideoxygalactose transaminase [Marinobacter sp. GN3S48]|uniref:dTDP-4-amino-4,6-dideoxygalactose transaminase n=1 Tax=Marinobacter sp. GN3S48 TaxID=3382302 RepID=UPI00387AD18E